MSRPFDFFLKERRLHGFARPYASNALIELVESSLLAYHKQRNIKELTAQTAMECMNIVARSPYAFYEKKVSKEEYQTIINELARWYIHSPMRMVGLFKSTKKATILIGPYTKNSYTTLFQEMSTPDRRSDIELEITYNPFIVCMNQIKWHIAIHLNINPRRIYFVAGTILPIVLMDEVPTIRFAIMAENLWDCHLPPLRRRVLFEDDIDRYYSMKKIVLPSPRRANAIRKDVAVKLMGVQIATITVTQEDHTVNYFRTIMSIRLRVPLENLLVYSMGLPIPDNFRLHILSELNYFIIKQYAPSLQSPAEYFESSSASSSMNESEDSAQQEPASFFSDKIRDIQKLLNESARRLYFKMSLVQSTSQDIKTVKLYPEDDKKSIILVDVNIENYTIKQFRIAVEKAISKQIRLHANFRDLSQCEYLPLVTVFSVRAGMDVSETVFYKVIGEYDESSNIQPPFSRDNPYVNTPVITPPARVKIEDGDVVTTVIFSNGYTVQIEGSGKYKNMIIINFVAQAAGIEADAVHLFHMGSRIYPEYNYALGRFATVAALTTGSPTEDMTIDALDKVPLVPNTSWQNQSSYIKIRSLYDFAATFDMCVYYNDPNAHTVGELRRAIAREIQPLGLLELCLGTGPRSLVLRDDISLTVITDKIVFYRYQQDIVPLNGVSPVPIVPEGTASSTSSSSSSSGSSSSSTKPITIVPNGGILVDARNKLNKIPPIQFICGPRTKLERLRLEIAKHLSMPDSFILIYVSGSDVEVQYNSFVHFTPDEGGVFKYECDFEFIET